MDAAEPAAVFLPDDIMSRPDSDKGMTNFDNSIDPGLEDDLRAGMVAVHSAWNFNGSQVWYQNGLFYEAVYVYHHLQTIMSAATLRELMDDVNDRFGWE